MVAARGDRPITVTVLQSSKDRAKMTIGATASKCSMNSIRRSLTS
jgi:hypothetical protein